MRRNLDLIEAAYQGRKYRLQQSLHERYGSGKDITVVDRGLQTWREDVTPVTNEDGSMTFTACNNTTTVVTPLYGGTLSLVNDPAILSWCPR